MIVAAALAAAGGAEAAGRAGPAAYKAPRTPYGTPDLQGIWTNTALTFLQRPPIFKGLIATEAEAKMMEANFMKLAADVISDKPIDPNLPAPPKVKEAPQADFLEMQLHLAKIDGQMRSSWIVDPPDGRLPFTDAGRKALRDVQKETYDDPESRPLTERCLIAVGSPEGPPMMNTGFNGNYQIVQTRDFVAIEVEMNHDVRIVRMNDRRHLPAAMSRWMGDSVGWWEGETLVVETTNLTPKGLVGSLGGGFAYSPKTKITERFTRTAADQILYEFQVEDPDYFTRPWKAQMPWRTSKGPIYEYACGEGNYSEANALSGAREQEREAAEAKAAAPPAAGK
jgi:hypothetical protein